MNLNAVGIVYRKEFTEWVRDRRTLISTVLVPLFLFPLMMVGFSALAVVMVGKAEKETPKIMILGGEDSPQLIASIKKLDALEIVPYAPNWKDEISNKDIRAAVEIPKGFEKSLETGQSETVKIYFYDGEMKSSFGANRLEKVLKDYRDTVVKDRLAAKNLPASVLSPFAIKQENVAPPEKVSGATFGSFIGYTVIILCMTGAMYPAIDLTAGEKERGTMETILSSPVSRTHLVLGKFLLVLTGSLITAMLMMFSVQVSTAALQKSHVLGEMAEEGEPAPQLALRPAAIASVIIMAVPLSVLFSAGLITIALFAKSHKEAQSYIAPLMFLVVIPAVAAMLPGVDLTPKLAVVPLLNVSLLCKELVTGEYHWNYIALIFASTCVYAAGALFLAVKMFQRESVLFRS
jgi:sodium transport system permease protein